MDNIVIDSKWSVWSTIKDLPPGQYLVFGDRNVLEELRRITAEYSKAVMIRDGAASNGMNVWSAYTHYVNEIPVQGCLVFRHVPHVRVTPFDPKLPLKGVVMAALDRLFKGSEDEVEVECSFAKVAQVRTAVYSSGHQVTVALSPNGCILRRRVGSPSLPLANVIRNALKEMEQDKQPKTIKLSMPGQSGYARVLVSNYSKSLDIEVGCSINGSHVELWIKGDQLDQAMDELIAKWITKGRHHSEFVEKMEQAVERYKERLFNLSELKPHIEPEPTPTIESPFEEDDTDDGSAMGLIAAVARIRQKDAAPTVDDEELL